MNSKKLVLILICLFVEVGVINSQAPIKRQGQQSGQTRHSHTYSNQNKKQTKTQARKESQSLGADHAPDVAWSPNGHSNVWEVVEAGKHFYEEGNYEEAVKRHRWAAEQGYPYAYF